MIMKKPHCLVRKRVANRYVYRIHVMRKRFFIFILASVIAAVVVLFIIRNVEKDDGVTYCLSTGVKSYTLKTLGDTLQIIENNLDNTLGYSMTMYRKGNGYYAKLLGKERLVMSNSIKSRMVYKAQSTSENISVVIDQVNDTIFSSFICNSEADKAPQIRFVYDYKYRILSIGRIMPNRSFMPQ